MRKSSRLLATFLMVVMMISLSFTAFADYSLPTYVRIGLIYGSASPDSVTLHSDYGFILGTYDEREFTEELQVVQTTVTVSKENNRLTVTAEDGTVLASDRASVGLKPNASGMDQKLKIETVEYRGAVDCIVNEDGIGVINVVFLDHYLYGVISREMSPSWHVEALKAQAVCARNYVAAHLNKHSADGFDLCSGVHCQAYSGTNVEAEGTYAPVDSTTRQVLTYDGNLAELYYSASMGPTTENVKYVWGNEIPYLVSVDNSYEDTENIPNGIWTAVITADEATTIMRNKGYDVGQVTNIEVLSKSPNGRVTEMKVTGTEGEKTFQREACRTLFNTFTKSQMFSVEGNGGTVSQETFQVTDGATVAERPFSGMVILSASGRSTLSLSELFVTNGITQKKYTEEKVENETENTSFTFSGIGWGHSVGMSQYGAKGMAEAGKDYIEILLHYFPGTNLENAY